jgi:hypothetical protein
MPFVFACFLACVLAPLGGVPPVRVSRGRGLEAVEIVGGALGVGGGLDDAMHLHGIEVAAALARVEHRLLGIRVPQPRQNPARSTPSIR